LSALAVALVAVAFLAAGCGGSSGVASVSTSTSGTTPQSGAVAFARCMRSHGASNWPDPTSGGVFDKSKLRQLGINPTRIRAIEDGPCNHLLPATSDAQPETPQQQATRQADGLSFARCMRSRGVSRFPDPTAQGQLTVEMVEGQGIDVHSPAVLRVVQACLPASHGALTPAKIREALANTHG
jgi:hypothetical protein